MLLVSGLLALSGFGWRGDGALFSDSYILKKNGDEERYGPLFLQFPLPR